MILESRRKVFSLWPMPKKGGEREGGEFSNSTLQREGGVYGCFHLPIDGGRRKVKEKKLQKPQFN